MLYWERYKTKIELMEYLSEKYKGEEIYLDISRDPFADIPMGKERILRRVGRRLIVWDDVGGILDEFPMFAPINGGTVLYRVS